MATAYTSLLGLALPVQGELQGTWGDTVNNSITSLLDTAVAGTTTLSTDADVTLSTTTGAANQARQAIILWTANGTVTRNITAPAQSKIYTVINKTAGTQSIVLRGVGPTTGVTIPAGASGTFAWNGTDFVDVSNYVNGNATINGSLTVNGNATFKGNTTIGDATADSLTVTATITSNLLFTDNTYDIGASGATRPRNLYLSNDLVNAGAVTFNATTQNLALGTSQTSGTWTAGGAAQTGALTLDQSTKAHTLNLGTGATENLTTKTINLGTAGVSGSTTAINIGSAVSGATNSITINGNPTFSGGTANGVGYLNGSKVLTTGSALTFDGTNLGVGASSPAGKLNVESGDILLRGGKYIVGPTAGGNGAGAIRGVLSGVLGSLIFQTENASAVLTDVMVLDAYGYLGLGMTPSAWGQGRSFELFQSGYGIWNGTNSIYSVANAYYNSGFKYANTGSAASHYYQYQGEHVWSNAASGTAGNAITFNQAMKLDAGSLLTVNTTTNGEYGVIVAGGAKTISSGIPQYQFQGQDTTAMAAGVGGAINFTGKYTTGGAITSFASVEAYKENATSGQYGAALVLKTRVDGGAQTARLTISSTGMLGLSLTPKSNWTSDTAGTIEGAGGSLYQYAPGADIGIVTNGYYDGFWKRKASGYAGSVFTTSSTGGIYLRTANTGAADSTITWVDNFVVSYANGPYAIGCIGVGNTAASSSGAGITFPATQSASTNANTLDDYEEGTWTPTAFGGSTAGTTTYGAQTGYYTKVGRLVTVDLYLSVTNMTGTGDLKIGNLPFTADGVLISVGATITDNIPYPSGTTSVSFITTEGSTTFRLWASGSNVGWGGVQVDTAYTVFASVTYRV